MFICKIVIGLTIIVNFKAINTSSYPWLEQIVRQEILVSGCDSLHLNTDRLEYDKLDHILVDHKHKFLYCYVPKVACTNWKRVLMVLTDRSNVTNLMEIPATVAHSDNSTLKLSDLDETTIKSVLKNYTTFLMVRHPFERLLSAFRNKFEDDKPSAKYFQSRYGKHIIKNYRKGATEADLSSGANVHFREFVQYLIEEGLNSNEHWRPIGQLCQPCALNYTFVGKYESFDEDSRILLRMIKAPFVLFPQTKNSHTSERLRYYYQQLSLGEIERLYKLYEADFRLFGYTLETILGFDIG